MVVPTN